MSTIRILAPLALLAALFAVPAPAQTPATESPTVVLEATLQQMLTQLREQRDALKQEPALIYDVVEAVLVPRVDFGRASRWALGRHWRQASPDQRQAFAREFRTLLVRFYSAALVEYVNSHEVPDADIFRFLPLRVGADDRDVVVRSEVRQPSGAVIPVNYQMYRTPRGWRVYDVMVEGISMVASYRSTFDQEIREGGIDGLIRSLRARNRALAAGDCPRGAERPC